MDDKKAVQILAALKDKYPLDSEEQEAVKSAIGILSWTALAKSRLDKLGRERKAKRDKSEKW